MYRISRGYRDTPHRTSSTNVRRDAVGKPNFVFSKRKLHFQQRSPSSDSLLYGQKIRYRVSYNLHSGYGIDADLSDARDLSL